MGGRVARVGGVVGADGVREGLVRRAWQQDWHRWTVSRSRRSSPRFVLCVSECECAWHRHGCVCRCCLLCVVDVVCLLLCRLWVHAFAVCI